MLSTSKYISKGLRHFTAPLRILLGQLLSAHSPRLPLRKSIGLDRGRVTGVMQKMFLKNSTIFVRSLRAARNNNPEKRDSSFLGSLFGGSSQKNEMSTVQEVSDGTRPSCPLCKR